MGNANWYVCIGTPSTPMSGGPLPVLVTRFGILTGPGPALDPIFLFGPDNRISGVLCNEEELDAFIRGGYVGSELSETTNSDIREENADTQNSFSNLNSHEKLHGAGKFEHEFGSNPTARHTYQMIEGA